MLKRSQLRGTPAPHAGLGLDIYAQTTSPLRRYADLVVHQQLRAWLAGRPYLEASELSRRVAVAETAGAGVRRAERLSNQHWKLVYLRQNDNWQGEGVVVEADDGRCLMLIPELALEAKLRVRDGANLNDRRRLALREVDLPDLRAWFRLKD